MDHFVRMRVAAVLSMLFLLLLLAGCVENRDLGQNAVVAHIPSEPDNLHPTNGNAATRSYIFQYTQKRLLRPDLRKLETIPQLVESMPEISDDGLKYTYRLKDGIEWDDGEAFSVEDVIFTLKVNKCPLTDNTNIRSFYKRIEAIKTYPDSPRKFTMVCNEKYYGNPNIFETGLYMLQKSYWDSNGVMDQFKIADFNNPDFDPSQYPDLQKFMQNFNDGSNGRVPDKLVGLGPYQVTEWNVGNSIILERKEDWWGAESDIVYNKNYPPKIIFEVIKEDFASGLALKKQDVDVSTYISTTELIKLRKRKYFNQNYKSDFVNRFGYTYIGFNMRPGSGRNPYFVDRKVRRAMAYLVPVEEIMEVMVKNKASRQVSFVSPLKESYNDTLEPLPLNIQKAKQLLTEAGWEDNNGDNIREKTINGKKVPFRFNLNYMKSGNNNQTALMIKEQMYEAGVEVVPTPMDFSVFYKKAQTHEFDAMMGAWSSGSSPVDPEQIWHTKNWANKGYNFTGFGDAESDSLIELANRTLDLEKRRDLIRQLQAKIYHEQPYVFLYAPKRKIAIHKRFNNGNMYEERPGVILNNLELKPRFKGKNKEIAKY